MRLNVGTFVHVYLIVDAEIEFWKSKGLILRNNAVIAFFNFNYIYHICM